MDKKNKILYNKFGREDLKRQLEQENSEFTSTLQYFRDLNLKIDVLMERTSFFQENLTKLLIEGNQVRYVEMPKEESEIQILNVDEEKEQTNDAKVPLNDEEEESGPSIQTAPLDDEVKDLNKIRIGVIKIVH